jgi:hypothetical protein
LQRLFPEGIKDRECKRFALQERPPVPYVPEKDPVQEMISLLKSNQSLKTTIGADAELCLPIWHCGTREAFLMHVSSALDAIEKRGTFKAYKEGYDTYVENKKAAKEAKANLQLFATPASKGKKADKKGTEKTSAEASGKNCSEKRRILRRPRKAQLRLMLQPQIFMRSARPSTRKPPPRKKPPRSRRTLLRPRCFSFTQICYLLMQSTCGTR